MAPVTSLPGAGIGSLVQDTTRLAGALLLIAALATFGACNTAAKRDGASTTDGGAASTAGTGAARATAKPASNRPPEVPITNALALETFDVVWTRVDEIDFDKTHGGVDWIAVREEMRPRASQATTQNELRRVLHEMLQRLNRSHFAVIPGEVVDRKHAAESEAPADETDAAGAADASARSGTESYADAGTGTSAANSGESAGAADGDDSTDGDGDDAALSDEQRTFGLTLRLIDEKATIVAVAPGSSAERAGVKPGWAVVTVDGRDPTRGLDRVVESSGSMGRYAASAFVNSLDSGNARPHTLVFVDADDSEHTVKLRRRASPAEMVKVGNLPPMALLFESGWVDETMLAAAGATSARIGYIRFSVWLPAVAAAFNRAVDELRDADGIILDLRGNPGGFGGMVMGVGGHFVQEPVSIGSLTTRESTIEFKLNPRRSTRDGRSVEPISAPLAILMDVLSASTSEVFAGGLQDIGRARIFGEASAGAALPALMHRLPNGDVLLHAFADFRVPSGGLVEGDGVIPDEPRALTRKDLSNDGDPVLLDAVRWIHRTAPAVP